MPEPRTYALEFTRMFDAPCEEVFAAFVEPDAILAWWAPQGWHTPHVEMDVRVGGKYRFGMRSDSDSGLMFVHGEYLTVDPPRELAFTYVWEPGGVGERWREFALIDVTTTVTLRFRGVGTATEVFIRHAGFPTEDGCQTHRAGWSSNWDCLDAYVIHHFVKPHAAVEGRRRAESNRLPRRTP